MSLCIESEFDHPHGACPRLLAGVLALDIVLSTHESTWTIQDGPYRPSLAALTRVCVLTSH